MIWGGAVAGSRVTVAGKERDIQGGLCIGSISSKNCTRASVSGVASSSGC